MHSLAGAFGETVFVYGNAILTALDWPGDLRVLSLGLGLGYVEILTCALAMQARKFEGLYISSYEVVEELRKNFAAWISGKDDHIESEFKNSYGQILKLAAQHCALSEQELFRNLHTLWLEKRLNIQSEFVLLNIDRTYSCICFDAFSEKTSPELWNEGFLQRFIQKCCSLQSVFATYACKGALKRALKSQGFEVIDRAGFAGKRESTFAVRNLNP